MLKHVPQYQALSAKELRQITLRLMKIEKAYRHPERGRRMRAELDKIEAELKKRPEPAKA